jgi:hypothetical protein
MLIFASRERYFFVLGNLVGEIIIYGRKVSVEDFKVIPSQYIDQFLNIFKVSVSVLCKPLFVRRMIPTLSDTFFNSNAMLCLFAMEA